MGQLCSLSPKIKKNIQTTKKDLKFDEFKFVLKIRLPSEEKKTENCRKISENAWKKVKIFAFTNHFFSDSLATFFSQFKYLKV